MKRAIAKKKMVHSESKVKRFFRPIVLIGFWALTALMLFLPFTDFLFSVKEFVRMGILALPFWIVLAFLGCCFKLRKCIVFFVGLCIFFNWFTLFFFRSYQVYLGSMGDCTVFVDCIQGYEHECREYEIRRREECLKRQEQKRTVKYFLLSFF